MNEKEIILLVAFSENYAIGKDNQLLWHLSDDLKRFKRLTTGKTVIMGRKTYESIGKPLPNRQNIVLTRDPSSIQGVVVTADSIENAFILADSKEVYIIGGGKIYEQTIDKADKLEITRVHKVYEADTFFPRFDESKWILENKWSNYDEKENLHFDYETWRKA